MPATSREPSQHESPVAARLQGVGSAVLARPALVALLGAGSIFVALAAQGYLNRRLFLGDAPYLFLWAIALFIAAFPKAQGSRPAGGWLDRVVRVLLVIVAALVFLKVWQDLQQGRDFVVSVVLVFTPLVLVGLAMAGSRASSRPDDEPDTFLDHLRQPLTPSAAQRALDAFYLVCGVALAAISLVYWFKQGRSNDALIINTLSLVLLFIAVYRMDRGKTVAKATALGDPPRLPVEIGIVLLITAIAAFLRFWQLESLPYGVWFDEAQAGQEAVRFMEGGLPFTPMGTFTSNNPSPFFYLVALLFKLAGPTLFSLRAVQAMIGVATVPALYVLLRYILGWRAAVIGALMLGVSAWHVNFSRYGMCCNIEAPPFEILTLFFLLKGFRTGKLTDFAWGGLMMGIGQFTYAAFRIFPAIVAVYVVYALLLDKERVRKSIAGLLVYAVVALIAFAPMGVWAAQHWRDFMARTNQTSVFAGKNTPQEKMAALENSLRAHIKMLNFQGDGNGRHGLPGAPAIDFLSGALFIVGLGYCFYRWRSPTYPLLLAWFIAMMMSGVMSLDWEAPQQARTVVAIPAIYAIASIALAKVWQAWDAAARALMERVHRLAAVTGIALLVTAVLGLLVYVNYDRYFNLQMHHPEPFYAFSTVDTVVARRVAELGPTANRYFLQNLGTPVFSFLVGSDSPQRPADVVVYRGYAHMPLREVATKTSVYLLEPWRVTLDPSQVLHYYPHTQFVDHKDPFGKTMVYEFRVPPEDVNNLLGLTGRYYAGDTPQGVPLLERVDKAISFDWSSQPPVLDEAGQALQWPFSVEWSGALVPPDAGTYTLELVSDGQARVSLDNEWLDLGPAKTQLRIELAKGMHPLVIQFSGQSISLQWTPPNGQKQPIPMTGLLAMGPPENGLVGRYYRGETWQGRPEFIQVDPYLAFRWHPDPIEPTPWSATWTGKIDIPAAGKYLFQEVSNDRSWLTIDGRTYLDTVRGMGEVQIDLTAGRHDIVVKYANNKGYSEFRLMWRLPDGKFDAVPTENLFVK